MTRPAPPTALTEDRLLAYFEGNLSPDEARDLARLLQDDAGAQALLAEWAAQNDALASLYPVASDDPVPARLTDVIRHARAAAARPARPGLRVAAMVALLAVGAGTGWLARDLAGPAPTAPPLLQAALAAHATYVIETRHAVEVPASDSAHMNSWMSKRLGRAMQPPDLAASGFQLLGGRLLPGEGGTAALYMYEDGAGQRVTLYILPRRLDDPGPVATPADAPTQSVIWVGQDISCAVVGDLPRPVLQRLATSIWDQLV
ncbi:MAG: anti-sigma factor [Rhodobacteraceae bacterium]|nr:anti-sigma factor [Paracoccaceae bacterium]